ncbi:MAG: GTPase ObgE [Chloroflexota bacterium]|nr:GTPase ObgE [Chloroflexota bacterium]
MLIDRARIWVKAGDGGNGSASFRREKYVPRGGPDGGDGGRGGTVYLRAKPNLTSLLPFQFSTRFKAENGGPGRSQQRHGKNGKDLFIDVPPGTVVWNDETEEMLADLTEPNEQAAVARGGRGGLGNVHFKTSTRQAPRLAELGEPGEELWLRLELRMIADVGLVGLPNAGKSTLLAAASAARPKIADYPFTTLHPNLGVVEAGSVRYTVADVPGLIEGASEGKGLGLEFLRHVERCSALLHVLDCATLDPGRDPLSDLDVILAELAAYPVPEGQTPLLERPQLVALNKVDVPDARDLAAMVRSELESRGYRVFEISAVSREGLRELSFALAQLVEADRARKAAEPAAPRIVLRPKPVDAQDFTIRVEGGSDGPVYRILGAKPERWVAQTDFTNDEAVGYLADRLAKLGTEEELFRVGAVPGSTVVIGEGNAIVFDWEPTLTSAAELITSPRGADERLHANLRPTRNQRREEYFERMDAKAEARAELMREKEAGLWQEDDGE